MDLDPTYTDRFGDPLLRFTLDWTEHEHRQREVADGVARQIARAMNVRVDGSVVNPHLHHWDISNLYVIGASAFPQNPSQIQRSPAVALTLRAADQLIAEH